MVARLVAPLLSFLAYTAFSRAQAPVHVTPCDLVNSPQQYAGKVVQVRARISLAFEDFSLAQPGCEDKYPGVWLMYGGDEPTPTSSTVNDLSRKPGSVLKVNGRPIPLVHDAALDLFRDRLTAIRIGPIGDHPCNDCYLYEVTATLTGVFFAATDDAQQHSGYGHLGCCHLLAIQQVSDVDATRTSIPVGGTFQCTSENRQLSASEAERLRAFDNVCAGLTWVQCRNQGPQQIAAAAEYWNDLIKAEDGTWSSGGIEGNTSKEEWESLDKLKAYTVSIQSDDPMKAESKATGGVITREVCKASVPPLPMSAIVSCRNLWSEFSAPRAEIERMSQQAAHGEQPWRMGPVSVASREALNDAAKQWGIAPSKDLQTADCEKPMVVDGDQFVWCHWTARDGMQTLNVQVTRFGDLRKGKNWDSVPWFLTRGNGVVCSVVP